MNPAYKQLKTAADRLDSYADQLDKAASKLDKADGKIKQAKTAAAAAEAKAKNGQKKTAAEVEAQKAKLGGLAKTAAASIRSAGLISNQQQEDVFASQLLDHEQALAKLAKLATHVATPKRASVVVDDKPSSDEESADARWEKRAAAALSRLNIG